MAAILYKKDCISSSRIMRIFNDMNNANIDHFILFIIDNYRTIDCYSYKCWKNILTKQGFHTHTINQL